MAREKGYDTGKLLFLGLIFLATAFLFYSLFDANSDFNLLNYFNGKKRHTVTYVFSRESVLSQYAPSLVSIAGLAGVIPVIGQVGLGLAGVLYGGVSALTCGDGWSVAAFVDLDKPPEQKEGLNILGQNLIGKTIFIKGVLVNSKNQIVASFSDSRNYGCLDLPTVKTTLVFGQTVWLSKGSYRLYTKISDRDFNYADMSITAQATDIYVS